MIVELLVSSCLGFKTPPATQPPAPPPVPGAPLPATTPVAEVPGQTPAAATPALLPPAGIPGQATPPTPARRAFGLAAPAPPGKAPAQWTPGPGGHGMGASVYSAAPAGMTGGAYGYFYRPMDPKEAELDRKAREAAEGMRREQDAQKKAAAKASLQSMLTEQFQMRQQRRAEEIKRLEDEVKRLRDAHEKREKSREAIIARRVAELTGEDDLGF